MLFLDRIYQKSNVIVAAKHTHNKHTKTVSENLLLVSTCWMDYMLRLPNVLSAVNVFSIVFVDWGVHALSTLHTNTMVPQIIPNMSPPPQELEEIRKSGMKNFRNIQVDESNILTWQGLIVPVSTVFKSSFFSSPVFPLCSATQGHCLCLCSLALALTDKLWLCLEWWRC